MAVADNEQQQLRKQSKKPMKKKEQQQQQPHNATRNTMSCQHKGSNREEDQYQWQTRLSSKASSTVSGSSAHQNQHYLTSAAKPCSDNSNGNRQHQQHRRLLTQRNHQKLRLEAPPPARQLGVGVEARAPHIGGALGLVKSGVDFCRRSRV